MSKVLRSIRNFAKGYSTAQLKVLDGILSYSTEEGHILKCTATSNDPWGSTGTAMLDAMSEIAQMTFTTEEFDEIMDILAERLKEKGKNWRRVLKSLKVLDYALHEGSEWVVTWAVQNLSIIKEIRNFQYIDENGRDVGHNGKIP
jgi:epsin